MATEDRRAYDPFAPPPVEEPKQEAHQPEPEKNTAEPAGLPSDLKYLSKPDLQALAEERKLDTSGTRPELIARLRDHAGT